MHEWHTNTSTNPLRLINEFMGYRFTTDYSGHETVQHVRLTGETFKNEQDAINFITRKSYGGNTAYIAAYTTKMLTNAYLGAYNNFVTKHKEYSEFNNILTIGYGRKSNKVTCPHCESSISLAFGNRFKVCPVCGSKKIISDSNWKTLETKKQMVAKAAENLAKEAERNGVTFVCGIEWHC